MVQGAVLTLTDITERKAANARLRRSEERLSLALNASGMIGTWDWDLRENVIYADPNFARIYTVDPERAARARPWRSTSATSTPTTCRASRRNSTASSRVPRNSPASTGSSSRTAPIAG